MVSGRTTDPRTFNVATTTGSAAVTAPAGSFIKADVGRIVTATGIPAGTTLATVTSDTAATLSASATTTNNRPAVIGATPSDVSNDSLSYGFFGWSPESEAESNAYSVSANNAGVVPPDRITNPTTSAYQQRTRS